MTTGLCPSCGGGVDFSADEDESMCVGCGTSVKVVDAANHFQNVNGIAAVILDQLMEAKAGDRIALEWHTSKMAAAIPFEKKLRIKPAMKRLVETGAIKLITSEIQLIEITQSGLNPLESLKHL
jgi:hypothetical protein